MNTSVCSWEPKNFSTNQLLHPLANFYIHKLVVFRKLLTTGNDTSPQLWHQQSFVATSYLGQRGGRKANRVVKVNIFPSFFFSFKGFSYSFHWIFILYWRKRKSNFSSISQELKTFFLFGSLQVLSCTFQEWTKFCIFPHLAQIFQN